MPELRKLSVNDGMDVYQMLQDIPLDENGLQNKVNGMTFEEYKDWLIKKQQESEMDGIVDGWKVPSTTYWLYADGVPVGFGKLAHRRSVSPGNRQSAGYHSPGQQGIPGCCAGQRRRHHRADR